MTCTSRQTGSRKSVCAYLGQLLRLLCDESLVNLQTQRGQFSVPPEDVMSVGREGCAHRKENREHLSSRLIHLLQHTTKVRQKRLEIDYSINE